jgi:hypothetical protein
MRAAADRLEELQRLNDSMQTDRDLWIKVGREKLESIESERDEARAEVERLKDKIENQEEISRDLYYERGLLQSEVQYLKHIGGSTEMVRLEPSRLEIAAQFMVGSFLGAGEKITNKQSLKMADALILAAKEGK